jgi:phospholipid N-methyltransferase
VSSHPETALISSFYMHILTSSNIVYRLALGQFLRNDIPLLLLPRHRFSKGSAMTTQQCGASDNLTFLKRWLRRPLGVASVLPSGRALSRLMTSEISGEDGPVLELGPGTGVFTTALLARGVAEADVTLVECDPHFTRLLRLRYPAARVVNMDASLLVESGLFHERQAGVAISGLPLLSMPQKLVTGILGGVFNSMKEGGYLYQFTYGPKCPVPPAIMTALGLTSVQVGWTPFNLPPASVYRISRTV